MPHIVTDKCVKCKYTDCVTVCPVDCFHEAEGFLVIDPEICIDCGVCIPECPVEAIINDETYIEGKSLENILQAADEELTPEQANAKYLADFNKRHATKLPQITECKTPLATAEEFSKIANKIIFIKEFDRNN